MSHKDKASYDSMPPFTYSCMADPWQNLMFLSPPATLTDFWEVCLRNVVPKRCDLIVSRNVIQLQGSWKRSKCWLSKKLFLIALPPKCRVRGTSRRADYREMSTCRVRGGGEKRACAENDLRGRFCWRDRLSCQLQTRIWVGASVSRRAHSGVRCGGWCWWDRVLGGVCVCVYVCVYACVCVCVWTGLNIPMHSIGSRARNDTYIRRYLL